jgi:hypothetical protein
VISRRRFHQGCALSLIAAMGGCGDMDVPSDLSVSSEALTTTRVDASWVLDGFLHVLRGTTDFKQNVSTKVWSTPENAAISLGVLNGPFRQSTAPVDAAYQSGTSLFLMRGTTLFERRNGTFVAPVNMTTDSAWTGLKGPFAGNSNPVDAAVMVGTTTLYVFRGDTLYVKSRDAWMDPTYNLQSTSSWGGPNRPFSNTTAPLDTAYFEPTGRTLHYIRGTNDFVSPLGNLPVNLDSSTQWAASNGPLDRVLGSFSITAAPAAVNVAWGTSTSVALTITSNNGFNGPITLSTSTLPVGYSVSFSPAAPVVPAFGTVTTQMTISTQAAATKAGLSTLTVTGTAGSDSASATIKTTVTRTPGVFGLVTPVKSGTASCGPAKASVSTFASLPTIVYSSTSPAFTSQSSNFSGNYAFSANCKAAVQLGSLNNGIFSWSIMNLGFSKTISSASPGTFAVNDSGPNANLSKGYFSPDSSLFVSNIFSGGRFNIALFDVLTGNLIGQAQSSLTDVSSVSLVDRVVTINWAGGGSFNWNI